MLKILSESSGFQWDEGNLDKNWNLHFVTNNECEEVFFNVPLIVKADSAHSQDEIRYFALGQTDAARWLFVAFTLRDQLIRVISARDMNQRESQQYDRQLQGYSSFRRRR